MTPYLTGTVDTYDDNRGYGYIVSEVFSPDGQKLLFHRKSLRDPDLVLEPGDEVRFVTQPVATGTLATDVHLDLPLTGIITAVPRNDALGLIAADDVEAVSFALSDLVNRNSTPRVGQKVVFSVSTSQSGSKAKNVIIEDGLAGISEEPSVENEALASDILAQAILARDSRQLDLAAELYSRGLKECPTTQIVMSFAAMEKNRNRKQAAMSVYEEGIRIFPNNAKLREDAGVLAASIGKPDRALELLNEALKLCREKNQAGEKGVLLGMARVHYQMGTTSHLKEATKYYSEAHRIFEREGRRTSVPQLDTLFMNLARIRTQHHRGAITYNYFTDAGFTIARAYPHDQITNGADFIVRVNSHELTESYGISGDVLVRCMFKAEIGREDIDQLDKSIATLGEKGVIDEQIAFLVISSLSENLQGALYRRIEDKSRLAAALVPIPQSEIESGQPPLSALRSILDRWLYRRDLFQLNSPVVGRRFFGRDKPLAELRDAIDNGASAGVFGLRKVGKTSLLKETERRATEGGDIVVFVDLLRIPADINDARWLYWKLASELFKRCQTACIKGMSWRLGGVYNDYLDIPESFPVATAFDSDLTRLLETLRSSKFNPRPRVVLLFDEIERLLPNHLGKSGFSGFFDFMSYLRGVSQETSDFIIIVTGANASIAETPQFERRDNPVFNYFQEIYLPLLENTETKTMIRSLGRGMGVYFDDIATDYIYKLTGGHPFFTRQLCSFVARRHSERPARLGQSPIADLLDEYLEFCGKDFEEITDRLSRDYPLEKELLVQLALSGGSMSISEFSRPEMGGDPSLKHLAGYQLVRIREKQIYLSIGLLGMWIKKVFS